MTATPPVKLSLAMSEYDHVRDLLDARQLSVEQRAAVTRALQRLGDEAGDIADALIGECASEAGCERTVTFDMAAAKLGMVLLR